MTNDPYKLPLERLFPTECGCLSFENSFSFLKIDEATNAPLSGAVFTLSKSGKIILAAASNSYGIVQFSPLMPGQYTLTETMPPAGYETNEQIYQVMVDSSGSVLIDGVPSRRFRVLGRAKTRACAAFTILKQDAVSSAPLSGAAFEIRTVPAVVGSAVSALDGSVSFDSLLPGSYELVETQAPVGYRKMQETYRLEVSADGTVTIDGAPADGARICNIHLSSFGVLARGCNNLPLPGIQFTLSQNGAVVYTATSGVDGYAGFGVLAPGTYSLAQSAAPDGYQPYTRTHTVSADLGGSITVDGAATQTYIVTNQLI